ncbi:TonB-dependent receptor plug domain-containing protein [Sphingomonas sp. MMS24-J13]|uniref:TonB-dependent receptor plug domain-containing protein n=1 Tax=Sphingomonas sp. MMS24-J13 TaxID=3238686 RepID=UPI003850483B
MAFHSSSHVARVRSACLAGCAAILLAPSPAFADDGQNGASPAQEASPGTQATDAAPSQDIVVTGSLVRNTGFKTPTPVTVLDSGTLARVSAPNIADAINQMPALRPSLTPTSAVNAGGGTQVGGNYLDLRGLGYARTLVLLDGRRYVPSNATGAINLNNIPQALIDRVDIVTGGASAAYGADAVAGVVNLQTKANLEGIKATIQGGEAGAGDYRNVLVSVAGGVKLNDHLHLVLAGEYSDNTGISRLYARRWAAAGAGLLANPNAGNGGLGTPDQPRQILVTSGLRNSNSTANGVITGVVFKPGFGSSINTITGLPSYLKGIQFNDAGKAVPYALGTMVTSGTMLGGDGVNGVAEQVGATPITRYTAYGKLSGDLAPGWTAFVEASYSHFHTLQDGIPSTYSYTIAANNFYLPSDLAATLAANNVSSITVNKLANQNARTLTSYNTDVYQVTMGVHGELGKSWAFDGYYGHGRNYNDNISQNNRILARYALAIDAVADPAHPGSAICRSTLTNPGNGCVPLNIMGTVDPSNPALKYVNGTAETINDIQQDELSLTLRGEPFSTWAGPVSVALGGEYRHQSLDVNFDTASQAGAYSAPSIPYSGKVGVKEAFGELLVPLLADSPYGKRLSIDVAGRVTDYSTSGTVETWKAGVDYAINNSIRLRATESRDIRAPNLMELNQKSGSSNLTVTDLDPRYLGQSYLVTSLTAGNPNLKPEAARTFTGGVVLTPTFIPRLSISVDYYNINIKKAIVQLTPATIVQQCFTSNTSACQYITRDGNGMISTVFSGPTNLAYAMTRGIDFELGYTIPRGRDYITFQGLVNYLIKTETYDGTNRVRLDDSVVQPTVAGLGGNPRWKANANVNYIAPGWRLSATARYVGGGYIDRTLTASSLNQLTVNGRVYFDLSGEVTIFRPHGDGSKIALFAAVANLLDNDPPITGAGGYGTTRALYDTIGRQFMGGVRVKY